MNNILIIYKRELNNLMKKRTFLFLLSLVLIITSLFEIFVLNFIISDAKVKEIVNYELIKMIINISEYVFIFISIFIPIVFFCQNMNNDKKNMFIDNILMTNIKKEELIYGKYLKGVESAEIILLSTVPIFYLSLFFGGVSIFNIVKIIFIGILNVLFLSIVYLYISMVIEDKNLSSIVCFLFGTILFLFLIFFFNVIERNFIYFCLFILTYIFLTFLFIKFIFISKFFDSYL